MLTVFSTPASRLEQRIPEADLVTPASPKALISDSERLLLLERQGKLTRLEQLIVDRAWTEVSLELLALGAPDWTLDRLCRMDDEWLCTLTRHPNVPDWLADTLEFRHESRELALFGAVHAALTQRETRTTEPPRRTPVPGTVLDCSDYC